MRKVSDCIVQGAKEAGKAGERHQKSWHVSGCKDSLSVKHPELCVSQRISDIPQSCKGRPALSVRPLNWSSASICWESIAELCFGMFITERLRPRLFLAAANTHTHGHVCTQTEKFHRNLKQRGCVSVQMTPNDAVSGRNAVQRGH